MQVSGWEAAGGKNTEPQAPHPALPFPEKKHTRQVKPETWKIKPGIWEVKQAQGISVPTVACQTCYQSTFAEKPPYEAAVSIANIRKALQTIPARPVESAT